MESLAWFVLACAVFGFVVYAYIASKVSGARQRRKRRERLPDTDPPLLVGRTYNVQLSHGRKLHRITIVGMSEDVEDRPWDLQNWIVGTCEDGGRVYLRPYSIRFVEDA